MRNLSRLLSVILVITLYGCGAPLIYNEGANALVDNDNQGDGTTLTNQALEHRVNKVLAAQIPKGSFTIASFHKNILLAGQVPTAKDKANAELGVNNTAGVKAVYSYLTIGPNETLADMSNDAYLTSEAKSHLIAQTGVNADNIKVVTCNKVVYLLGSNAGNQDLLNEAILSIKLISGVNSVVNLIESH